jgi:hypothetical protein
MQNDTKRSKGSRRLKGQSPKSPSEKSKMKKLFDMLMGDQLLLGLWWGLNIMIVLFVLLNYWIVAFSCLFFNFLIWVALQKARGLGL